MIELAQVSKRFNPGASEVRALEAVDLAVGAQEYVALLGPSGSGKSTLLHVIGCLDTPTSGSYRLHGQEVGSLDRNRRADLRREKVGFVFQRFHLMPRVTALENVALPMRFAGVPRRERETRARALLDRVSQYS